MTSVAPPSTNARRAPTDHVIAVNVRRCPSTNVDISLAYVTIGDPANEPILVIPGLNANIEMYQPELLEGLAAAGLYVIVVENRDTGFSTKLEDFANPATIRFFLPRAINGIKPIYHLHDLADDAVALLDHLRIQRAHIFGASMGGMIAQLVAIRHPTRVCSLTSTVSTSGANDLPDPPLKTKLGFLRKPKDDTLQAAIDTKYGWLLDFGLSDANRDREGNKDHMMELAKRQVQRSTYGLGLFRQTAALITTPSRDEDLKKITCPTLVIHGDKDVVVLPAHGERTASCLPAASCKSVVIKGMGHVYDLDAVPIICKEVSELAQRSRCPTA